MKGCGSVSSVFWTVCAVGGLVSISEAFVQPSSAVFSTREWQLVPRIPRRHVSGNRIGLHREEKSPSSETCACGIHYPSR